MSPLTSPAATASTDTPDTTSAHETEHCISVIGESQQIQTNGGGLLVTGYFAAAAETIETKLPIRDIRLKQEAAILAIIGARNSTSCNQTSRIHKGRDQ